MLQSFKSKS